MARLLSILLLLAGLGAAAFGALQLTAARPDSAPASTDAAMDAETPMESAASEPAPTPAPAPETDQADAGAALPMTDPVTDPEVQPAGEKPSDTMMGETGPIGELPFEPPTGAFDTGDTQAPVTASMTASEAFLEKLKTVPVAHETPASAEYKRAFDVTFAIDATGDATAADALPGRGVVETGEARVTERVSVRLSGAAFNIASSSPETQLLSPVTENVWRWRATPLSAGVHDLTFEVFAIDEDDVTPLRTYNDRVTVEVSGMSAAVAFADRVNPLFVLLGGLGSALAGAFGVARFFMKK